MTGAELIAAERLRQIEQKGWSPEHDDGHFHGELAKAAACYAIPSGTWLGSRLLRRHEGAPAFWPWTSRYWKPEKDRIHELVKAGALIAAEIDRLQRRNYTKSLVSCAVCGEKLSQSELAAIKKDIDWIPHGNKGHLIRIAGSDG